MPSLIIGGMTNQVQRERQHTKEFYRHFQSDNIRVPNQEIYIGIVELPAETLIKLGAPTDRVIGFQSLPTYYRILPYIRELTNHDPWNKHYLQIKTGYAEFRKNRDRHINPSDWTKANEKWVSLADTNSRSDRALLERVQYQGSLGQLLIACDKTGDNDIRKITTEFVHKAIQYSKQTGKIVDIIGTGNAIFIQKDGKVDINSISNKQLLLHDGLYSDTFPVLQNAKEILEELANGKTIDMSDMKDFIKVNDLANSLNYVRSINALAEELGLDSNERIDYLKTDKPIPWDTVLNLCEEHWRLLFLNWFRGLSLPGERKFIFIS